MAAADDEDEEDNANVAQQGEAAGVRHLQPEAQQRKQRKAAEGAEPTIETEALGEPTNKRSSIETEAREPTTSSITTSLPSGPWRRRAFIAAARSDSHYRARPAADGAAADEGAADEGASERAVDATDGQGQCGHGPRGS